MSPSLDLLPSSVPEPEPERVLVRGRLPVNLGLSVCCCRETLCRW